MGIVVARLATTAVKGLRLHEVPQVELDDCGARGDRAFYVIDERGRMVNAKQVGELLAVVADYDPAARELTLTFPDGGSVRGHVEPGEVVQTRFFSRGREARLVPGPWSEALSAHLGRTVRLVEPETAVDRGRQGAASLISRASLARLAQAAGVETVDPRRFRMLIEIDGTEPHEEDGWVGRRARVGGARLRFNGHVGRCLVTSRDPESGEIDLPTLDLLGGYRREVQSTEPLPFGIYGQVLEPGTVCVGDQLTLDG
jgi:uncharacterized protein YcbX